jgi:iron(III)-enterobactin esterase
MNCPFKSLVIASLISAMGAGAIPAQSGPTYPARDPHTAGYVTATELPDGANAPADRDGNFILGPTHAPARR